MLPSLFVLSFIFSSFSIYIEKKNHKANIFKIVRTQQKLRLPSSNCMLHYYSLSNGTYMNNYSQNNTLSAPYIQYLFSNVCKILLCERRVTVLINFPRLCQNSFGIHKTGNSLQTFHCPKKDFFSKCWQICSFLWI